MKRDMDLIRELLLKIEEGQSMFETLSSDMAAALGTTLDVPRSNEEAERLEHNLQLMVSKGLIEAEVLGGGAVYVKSITWEGHDFLDSVRNPETWAKTKKGALAAGGFTLDILKDLAKGLIKKQVEEHTGVKL